MSPGRASGSPDRFEPRRAFRPAWGLSNPHLQTLAGKFLRPNHTLLIRRERIETPDHDFLDVDIVEGAGVGGAASDADGAIDGRPTVLVFHGLEGSTRRAYMLGAFTALIEAGCRPVGVNFRGFSGEPNRTRRAYHSGETEDIDLLVREFCERTGGRVGALAYSLGGNALLKYLGEEGDGGRERVFGAAVVSVPFDLAAGSSRLEEGLMGRVYTSYFMRNLRRKIADKAELLRPEYDPEAIRKTRTLRQFDDMATAPLHGFADAEDYYAQSSSTTYVSTVRVPTMVVHAMDDPFLPPGRVPVGALEENPSITPVLATHGGHVGFVGGTVFDPEFWLEDVIGEWFLERANTSGDEGRPATDQGRGMRDLGRGITPGRADPPPAADRSEV